ncbi:MAG: DUF3667 domain-containing protein [Erythrobacter sp.]|uniref:DUF3667 domain-containing protein n=1 Tax=Erythrobacter sp. TaxID=1042 RepID=UPI0032635E63
MSEIAEGLGGVMEGALSGRAVEPADGESKGGVTQFQPEECANCGAMVTTTFCPQCGQKRKVHRSLAVIGHDLIHGVLHLDGKFWLTLPLLVFKPGKLTRRYINGERAKFVSPMAMFLFSVFAMFAIFQMLGLSAPIDLEGDASAQLTALVESERENVAQKIEQIDAELASDDLDQAQRIESGIEREQLETDLTALDNRGRNLTRWLTSGNPSFLNDLATQGKLQIADAKEHLNSLPAGSEEYRDLAAEIASAEKGLADLAEFRPVAQESDPFIEEDLTVSFVQTGVEPLDAFLAKWNKNPSLMLYKLQANGYKFSWLLIPLSIPFVWLVFAWKRRFKAYDHAIFVTYSLSFMSLLFIAVSLAGSFGAPVPLVVLPLLIIPPVHLYKQLRGTYEIGQFSALWRLLLLSIFIWIVLILFLQALLLLGAF